jgi:hypothetical protein
MKSEFKRVVTQASEEMLARWILKNLDWSGGNSDENGAFLTSILLEHRRQCAAPEAVATVERHRRHVELSPGVGEDAQKYALAVCDDILADLQRPQPCDPLKEKKNVD